MDKDLVVLIGGPILAVIFFIVVYLNNLNKYQKLLGQVKEVIDGRFRTGLFFYTVKLEGAYKGRNVICCLEQLQGGKEVLFVKVKPMTPAVTKVTLKDYPTITDEVMLYEGWLAPRFYLSSRYFDKDSFVRVMEKVIVAAEKIEHGSDIEYRPPKMN